MHHSCHRTQRRDLACGLQGAFANGPAVAVSTAHNAM
jgi:hypothetical protein